MLKKFRDMLSGQSLQEPPFALKAADLDKNFGLCYPMEMGGDNAPYTIERSGDEGYKLRGTKPFDVCENGQPVRYLFFAEIMPTP